MRILVVSTFALLLLTTAAFSQQVRQSGENPNTLTEEQDAAAARAAIEQQRQNKLEAQYKAALGRAGKTSTAPSDPWADVRSVKTPTGH
jgi:type II secretory pathway pseudopilin PulG